MRLFAIFAALVASAAGALAQTSRPTRAPSGAGDAAAARALMQKGARYLIASQESDGGWVSQRGPGITGLCVRALIQTPGIGPDHPSVQRGIEFVLRNQRGDGGIYSAEGAIKNYESAVALSMLSALRSARYAEDIEKLQKFLIENQWDESEKIGPDNVWYGGAGYGSGQRPDLSNTQMMLDALRDSGLPKDHPAYRKALVFVQRCQMRAESNDQPYAKGSNDGGFIYSPANQGESKAGRTESGTDELRTYGSMTYAGFKSMLYAGLSRDDPRVAAAVDWIGRYWTLDFNPNMPERQSKEGLYYYYHTFGRALAAWGEDVVRDRLGREHRWREELVTKLASVQREDGSWVNESPRWMEDSPPLVTAYALLALQAAFPTD